jgi:hypothetical protein
MYIFLPKLIFWRLDLFLQHYYIVIFDGAVQSNYDGMVLWRQEGGEAVSDALLYVWDIVIVYLWWCRVTMTAWSCDDTKVVTAVSDASLCV